MNIQRGQATGANVQEHPKLDGVCASARYAIRGKHFLKTDQDQQINSHMRSMVLVYLPTKLVDFGRANVGIHIPAPWFADVI